MKYFVYFLFLYLSLHSSSFQIQTYYNLKTLPAQKKHYFRGRKLFSDTTILGNSNILNYYYANLYLGNPSKKQGYIVDTGSSITTAPCQPYCTHCGKHLNSYYKVTSPQQIIKCSNPQCSLVTNQCPNSNSASNCTFSISYSEGSSLKGIFINETIRIGDDYENDKGHYLPIGCTTDENNLFYTQLADGIMGLSNSDRNFVTILYKSNLIKNNIFSLCLAQDGGYFSIGQINTTLHKSQIDYTPIGRGGFYDLHVNKIFVNQKEIKLYENYGSIVDSGTTITYIPKKISKAIIDLFKETCQNYSERTNSSIKICGKYSYVSDLGPCYEFPSEKEMNFAIKNIWPNITFNIGQNYSYVWTPENYLFNDTDEEENSNKIIYKACIGYDETGGNRLTLGSTWMHGYDIIFDRENMRIGFAVANCGGTEENPIYDSENEKEDSKNNQNKTNETIGGDKNKTNNNETNDDRNNNKSHVSSNRTKMEADDLLSSMLDDDAKLSNLKKRVFFYGIITLILLGIVIFLIVAMCFLLNGKPFFCFKIKINNNTVANLEINADIRKTNETEVEIKSSVEINSSGDKNILGKINDEKLEEKV